MVRIKNDIYPQWIDEIVKKHNAKEKSKVHWRLETDDINADWIPDNIIKKAKGKPMLFMVIQLWKKTIQKHLHITVSIQPILVIWELVIC